MSEFKDIVIKHSQINIACLVILPDEKKLPKINKGIVFIFAEWSSGSIIGFKVLTKTLNNFDLKDVKVYVLDADLINPPEWLEQGIALPHGWGETYWIKNYEIVGFLTKYNETDSNKIISNTIQIIDFK